MFILIQTLAERVTDHLSISDFVFCFAFRLTIDAMRKQCQFCRRGFCHGYLFFKLASIVSEFIVLITFKRKLKTHLFNKGIFSLDYFLILAISFFFFYSVIIIRMAHLNNYIYIDICAL